jgi:hypothetical protein
VIRAVVASVPRLASARRATAPIGTASLVERSQPSS